MASVTQSTPSALTNWISIFNSAWTTARSDCRTNLNAPTEPGGIKLKNESTSRARDASPSLLVVAVADHNAGPAMSTNTMDSISKPDRKWNDLQDMIAALVVEDHGYPPVKARMRRR